MALRTTMATLVLLLLLLFAWTTAHDVERSVVQLPQAARRVPAERGAPHVVLLEQAGGGVNYKFSNGVEPSRDVGGLHDVYLEARQVVAAEGNRQFVIEASASTKFEKIDELLEVLREAGVERLLLLADPRAAGGS